MLLPPYRCVILAAHTDRTNKLTAPLVDHCLALNPASRTIAITVSVVGSRGSEGQTTDDGWRDEADTATMMSAIVMMTMVTTAPSTTLRVSSATHRDRGAEDGESGKRGHSDFLEHAILRLYLVDPH